MIVPMSANVSISLDTRILDLPASGVGRLGPQIVRKLALALTEVSPGKDLNSVNVEDLLGYLPMRYEDRSSMVEIRHLYHGLEASLDLYVKVAGGYQVRNKRSIKQRLFIFEISATDRQRTGREVVVWTFLSGYHAQRIIESYTKRFTRGVRFIAFGKWEWDKRRQTYSLRLNKPDEIEILSNNPAGNESGYPEGDPALAAIHVGRCVPVYRKLDDLRPKQLREMIHAVLKSIPAEVIAETLPADLRKRQSLPARADALRQIHFPPENAALADYDRARSPVH